MGRPGGRRPGKLTQPPPIPPDLAAARQRNFQQVIDTGEAWCQARGLAPWGHLYRLVLAVLTESGGLVYSNDGKAFHPDPAQRRAGWDKDDQGKPLPDAVLADCYRVLRASLPYGHDAIGNNGGSTGILQQLSQDYVGARFPGKTWGWGSLADTMDIPKACGMFLGRLGITSDGSYQGMTFDPIAADVLRVQQPKLSEASSGNYSAGRVAEAKRLVDNWGPDYFKAD